MFPPFYSTSPLALPSPGRLHLLILSAAVLAAGPLSAQTLVYSAPVLGFDGSAERAIAPIFSANTPEIASGVHLAGPDREIVTAEIPFFSVLPTHATLTFSLYEAVDGSNSSASSLFSGLQPGSTPLYTTGPLTMDLTGPGPGRNLSQTLVFSNINTLVPQNFFWSITINSYTFDTSATGGEVPPPIDGQGSRIGPVYAPFLSGGTVAGTDTSLGLAFVRNPAGSGDPTQTSWSTVGLDLHGSGGTPVTQPGYDRTLAATFTAVPEPSVLCLATGALALLVVRKRRR